MSLHVTLITMNYSHSVLCVWVTTVLLSGCLLYMLRMTLFILTAGHNISKCVCFLCFLNSIPTDGVIKKSAVVSLIADLLEKATPETDLTSSSSFILRAVARNS